MTHSDSITEQDPQRLGARQILIVSLIILALIFDGLDIQLLALVSPVIIAEWGVSKAAFGPAMGAALIGLALGGGLGGWLGDRFGRKLVLISATFMFGCATAVASMTQSVPELALLRLVTGLGFGAAAPNGLALASEWLPPRARPLVVAILAASTPLGGVISTGAVVFLLPQLGWRGCFILCGALTVVVSIVMLFVLAESPSFQATMRERAQPSTYVPVHSLSASGLSSLDDHILSRSRRRFHVGAWAQFFCINFVAYSVAAWTPLMLTSSGFSIAFALQATFANSLASVAAATLISLVIARLGSRLILMTCCVTLFSGLVALAVILSQPSIDESGAVGMALIAATAVAGGSVGAAISVTYALLAFVYPTRSRARGIGLGIMMGRFGGVVSTLIGGALLSIRGDDPTPYLAVLAGAATIALYAITIIDRHIPKAVLAASDQEVGNVSAS